MQTHRTSFSPSRLAKKLAKRKYAKKASPKKAKKKAAKKKLTKKKVAKKPSGYKQSPTSRLLVPEEVADSILVKPNLLQKGLQQATEQLQLAIDSMDDKLSEGHAVREIRVTASFDAGGNFLGFGASGALSVQIAVGPTGD